MLQQAAGIGHAEQMFEPPLREFPGAFVERLNRQRLHRAIEADAPRLLERVHVKMGDVAPDHLATQRVGLPAHGVSARLVAQEAADLLGDGAGIAERHEGAAAVGQQFLGVPVGRRDDRLAAAEGVGERAGGDLRRFQVGGEVDVGGGDELDQFVPFDEAIVEDDVLAHAEVARHPFQAEPVGFALLADEIRMRGAEDDVDDVGELADHLRQRLEGVLDPLVRREQAEREDDVLPLDAELFLRRVGIDERHVGNAVGDDVDLRRGDAVDVEQELAAALRHHDESRGELGQFPQHAALIGRGLFQHGVERRHHRHADVAQQREDVPPRLAAEDAVLVLQRDDVDVAEVEKVGRAAIGIEVLLLELELHFPRVVVAFGDVVDRHDAAVDRRVLGGDRAEQVGGEGGDAALARQVVADEAEFAEISIANHRALTSKRATVRVAAFDRRSADRKMKPRFGGEAECSGA